MYFNAEEVLPAELLDEIQRYVQGAALYIPKQGQRAGWGEKTAPGSTSSSAIWKLPPGTGGASPLPALWKNITSGMTALRRSYGSTGKNGSKQKFAPLSAETVLQSK